MSSTRVTGTKNMWLVRTTVTISVLSSLVVSLRDTDVRFQNLPVSSPLSRRLVVFLTWRLSVKLHDLNVLVVIQNKKVWNSDIFQTWSWICKSLLQQQEATPIVVLQISQFVRSVTTEQRWKNRLWKLWGEKLSVTHLPVESILNVRGGREGNENESCSGRDRKTAEEEQRGREKMETKCSTSVGTFEGLSRFILRESVRPAFLPEAQSSQPSSHGVHNVTHSWTPLQPERANYWGRGMQGGARGIEQEGRCATTSPTSKQSHAVGIPVKLQLFKCSHVCLPGLFSGVLKLFSVWINR